MKIHRRILWASACAIVLSLSLLLSACAGSPRNQSAAEESTAPEMAAPDYMEGEIAGMVPADEGVMPPEDAAAEAPSEVSEGAAPEAGSGSAGTAGSTSPDLDKSSRMVVYTAEVSIISEEFTAHIQHIKSKAASLGGYIQSENVSGMEGGYTPRTGYLVLRIPIEHYEAFLNDVCSLGKQESRNQSGDDVTLTYFDQESRLKTLQTQLDKLNEILDKTTKLEDITYLVQEISRVQLEIEQLTTEHRRLGDLVQMATVTVNVSEYSVVDPKPVEPISFGNRVQSASNSALAGIVGFFEGLVIFFAGNWPWIVVLLVAGFLTWFFVKRGNKKRAEKRASMPQMTPPPYMPPASFSPPPAAPQAPAASSAPPVDKAPHHEPKPPEEKK